MTKETLVKLFNQAIEGGNHICVAVTIPGQEDLEYIINVNPSLKNKLNYYCETYDEECVHKNNQNIKIVGAAVINFAEPDLKEIEND